MANDRRTRFRAQYGLDGEFEPAFGRWSRTSSAQGQGQAPKLGPHAQALALELHDRLAVTIDKHNDALHASDVIHTSLAGWSPFALTTSTNYAVAIVLLIERRQSFERAASAAWNDCRRIEECIEVLEPTYVHFDKELNEEHQALNAAIVAIDSGLERLARLDAELARSGRTNWYRTLSDGRAAQPVGFEEPIDADERATFSKLREGRDPVVALLVAREILQLVPTIGGRDVPQRGRPAKGNLNRLVAVFSAIDLLPARIRDVLVDLGFDGKTEAHPDNIRRIRNKADANIRDDGQID